MRLRISANYPATDGSMPESVEVEWEAEDTEVPSPTALLPLLDRVMTTSRTSEYGAREALDLFVKGVEARS